MSAQTGPARGFPRLCRGGALAVISAALAVSAHALGGGGLPDPGLTLLLACAVGAAGVALAGRRRGPLAILVAVGASHLGIHLILTAAGRHDSMGGAPVAGGSMLAGHLLAVLLAGLVLARAEAAAFAMYAAWTMVLPQRLVPPKVAPTLAFVPHPEPVDRLLEVRYRRLVVRRGPPIPC